MDYTKIGSSPTINVFVYTHVGGSPVTLSIVLYQCRWFDKNLVNFYKPGGVSPIENFMVCTPVVGLSITFSKALHT